MKDSCCTGGNCRTREGVTRRGFLKAAAAGALAPAVIAGPFTARAEKGAPLSPDHFVPVDKKLRPEWLKALFEKGARRIYTGEQRAAIGMPCGGIGAGQLYIGGDGTFREWEIMNRHVFSGFGATNFEFRVPPRNVDHGFALAIREGGEIKALRRLREEDFPDVEFVGEYPIAEVRYPSSPNFPLEGAMRVFSPFIPLNAADSTLPVTMIELTVKNNGDRAVTATLLSWMENVAALHTGDLFSGARHNSIKKTKAGTWLECRIDPPSSEPGRIKSATVFEDFEKESYGEWKAEGEAFGGGPTKGTAKGQQRVVGFEGDRLVNSFPGTDTPQGRLVSPEFTIERQYINFLVGGGSFKGETCVNLVVEGKKVASRQGKDNEQLEWTSIDADAWKGKKARIEIVDRRSTGWGHILADHFMFADEPKIGPGGTLPTQEDFGRLGMLFAEAPSHTLAEFPWQLPLRDILKGDGALTGDLSANALDPNPEFPGSRPRFVAAHDLHLAAGESRTIHAALIWHFPNHKEGHAYAARFADIDSLVDYIGRERERLARETLHYHDTYYDSTLPQWLLDRLHAPVANLATNTVQYWKNGRMWAWEGVGCCEGTCTHVWNYEHATGRLFPELARSTREMQDLGVALQADGLVGFRGNDVYASDGQVGTILKCYREHLMSRDMEFLRRNYANIKKALEYSIRRDGNGDGLIEDEQHNTYDIMFWGANTFVGGLYLAALKAGAAMASAMGDTAFAERCTALAESGGKLSVERLFNGEYFEQQVDLKAHPQHQYAQGCLADQMFGQGWAHQVGLGYLYPEDAAKSSLESIWKYNWAPDVGPQTARHKPDRYFARRGDAGLLTCTWPHTPHLGNESVLYRDEVWTGIEYQVANHMIWEGKVQEALAIVRAIDERYDGRVHNPWNEIECGDHYARAMASWGCVIALAGFIYDGPAGRIGFAPNIDQEHFRCFFTSAEGWGTLDKFEKAGMDRRAIEVKHGTLRIASVTFDASDRTLFDYCAMRIESAGKARPLGGFKVAPGDPLTHFTLAEPITLRAGEALVVEMPY